MKLLHNVGTFNHSNYNTREQIVACRDKLSFDGVYLNVWENRDLLLGRHKRTILFVMWDYVGKDNTFDAIPNQLPIEKYCDVHHLMDLERNYGCIIASHSYTHRNLTLLSDGEVIRELDFPWSSRGGQKLFAYPYGDVDARVAHLVEKAGYDSAWSVHQGNDTLFQRKRTYLT